MTGDQNKAITNILAAVSRTLRRGVTVNQIIRAIQGLHAIQALPIAIN
jgi:hypothetical protein